VKHLNHEYKLEQEHLQKLFIQVWNLMLDFGEVKFCHIGREQNKEADRLVNEVLDKKQESLI
jgi:ribonuclease HI